MISIKHEDDLIALAVFGEFTLADFKDFEQQISFKIEFEGKINLLLDLSDMLSYTLDVAWEDIKFARKHAYDFDKIAIVANDQWLIWSAWVSNLFVEADVQVFEDAAAAEAWLGVKK